jgi:hypothetical protein
MKRQWVTFLIGSIIWSGCFLQAIAAENISKSDLILLCEEKNLSLSLNKTPTQEDFDFANRRNNSVNRPYIVIKYIDGKLSFNNNGTNLLIDEVPNHVNILSIAGDIEFTQDKIIFKWNRISGLRTEISIDRYTGFYISHTLTQNDMPYFSSSGKCETSKERKF